MVLGLWFLNPNAQKSSDTKTNPKPVIPEPVSLNPSSKLLCLVTAGGRGGGWGLGPTTLGDRHPETPPSFFHPNALRPCVSKGLNMS